MTRRVKNLAETIIISGDQLKSQGNLPEYLTINEESNLFILVLVTLFKSGLDYFISLFCFVPVIGCIMTDYLQSRIKFVKKPTISRGEKLEFLIYVSKRMFCSSDERKMECLPKETRKPVAWRLVP